jgi:hypothetical protein
LAVTRATPVLGGKECSSNKRIVTVERARGKAFVSEGTAGLCCCARLGRCNEHPAGEGLPRGHGRSFRGTTT